MKRRSAFLIITAIVAVIAFLPYPQADAQVAVPSYRYGTQPVVLIPNLDNVILNYVSLQNYWQMGDSPGGTTPGPCATAVADIAAGDSFASPTPSPVPLTCSAPTASPYPYLGATGMVQDGSTSIGFSNGILGHQGQYLFTSASGVFSNLCNGNAGGSCTKAFSVFCTVDAGLLPTTGIFFDADGTGTGLGLGASFANGAVVNIRGTKINAFATVATGIPYTYLYSFDGTSKSTLWLNGVQAMATTSPLPQASANSVSYFGQQGTAGTVGWNGRIEKCGFFNAAMTDNDAYAFYASTGFW